VDSSLFIQKKIYFPKHSTKIVEIKNGRFIKNNKVNGSEISFNIKNQEGMIQVPCVF
jgi:hypothetical protein